MKLRIALIALLIVGPSLAVAKGLGAWKNGPWSEYDLREGITLYENDEVPAEVSAFRADTVINAPASKLYPLMISHKRAAKLPFMKEYRILKGDGNSKYVYQKVKNPGLAPRDFTLWIKTSAPKAPNAGKYRFSWGVAPVGVGPAPKEDVVRVTTVEGEFVLTPIDGGKRTLASYRFVFDPNTWAPSFAVNGALADSAVDVVMKLRTDGEKSQ